MSNRIKLAGDKVAAASVRRIDMTPTFEEATAIAIAVIERSSNEDAKAKAREELFRYARELDRLKAAGGGTAFDTQDTPTSED